jgi:hypothetical protein
MLESLLGNKSAEKVMLALYHHGELHASAIAQIYETALDPIKKQLERFEEAGYLNARPIGRSRLYSFNKDHPLHLPLIQLIQSASMNQKIYKHKIINEKSLT